jgi:pimeloyl-ACP methyl ester carboxylesterase
MVKHGLLASAIVLAMSATAGAQAPKSGYAPVNGLKLYYEIHGSGEPTVLLHGGLGSTGMFGDNIVALAKTRQVIAVDLQAHGRTGDIDRPLRLELMADDVAGLLKHLNIAKADFVGYSMGGGVALQTAVRHPAVVNKLVIVSTYLRKDAVYPEILAQQGFVSGAIAEQMKGTPMHDNYMKIAPRKEDFPKLLDKIGAMMKQDFDYTKDLASVQAPTLIVAADADLFYTRHAVEMFELMGGGKKDGGWDNSGRPKGQLAILPGLTHYNIFMSPMIVPTISQFLDPAAPPKW